MQQAGWLILPRMTTIKHVPSVTGPMVTLLNLLCMTIIKHMASVTGQRGKLVKVIQHGLQRTNTVSQEQGASWLKYRA